MPRARSSTAPGVAAQLGLERLVVKMEVERLGLPSFKMVGASWAVCRALSARAGLAEPVADVRRAARARGGPSRTSRSWRRPTATTAEPSPAWHACSASRARILVPAHTAAARIDAIASEGADVEVVHGSYDDAVALSAAAASDSALVISDTSWPGYEDVPGWVADGYSTIFEELSAQLEVMPELVVVQIGVGALASAAVRALAAPGRVLVGVEPADAACVLEAVRAGEPVLVAGPHRSLMAGLNCGLASRVALPDMARGIGAFCTIDDRAAERAVRLLHAEGLACGETGASGVAGLLALREDRPRRDLAAPRAWRRARRARDLHRGPDRSRVVRADHRAPAEAGRPRAERQVATAPRAAGRSATSAAATPTSAETRKTAPHVPTVSAMRCDATNAAR